VNIILRKLIFAAGFNIFVCLTLPSQLVMAQGGMSMELDKKIYYLGDTIHIKYSIPNDPDEYFKGIYYGIQIRSEGNIISGMALRAGPKARGVWEVPNLGSAVGHSIARDFTAIITRSARGKPKVTIKHNFRVRQSRFKSLPGALALKGTGKYTLGDSIIAEINLPHSLKIFHSPYASSDTKIFNYYLELYYLNRQTHGGAILPSRRVHTRIYMEKSSSHFTIKKHSEEKIITKYLTGRLMPGTYELRLVRKNEFASSSRRQSDYVVDSEQFEVVIEPWPNSLKVESPDDLKVGEDILVQLNSASTPFKDYASSPFKRLLEIHLYKVIENSEANNFSKFSSHEIESGRLNFVAKSEGNVVATDRDIIFRRVNQPGKYVLLLTTNFWTGNLYLDETHHAFSGFILDQLEINVGPRKKLVPSYSEREIKMYEDMKKKYPQFQPPAPPMEPHVGTGEKILFNFGKKIPVEAYMPKTHPGARAVVALKRHEFKPKYVNGEPMGEQVIEWEVGIEKKTAWTIPGNLVVGSYDLVLKTIFIAEWDKKEHTRVAAVNGFQVAPKLNTVKINLNNKKESFYGKTLTFDVEFPKSIDSKKFRLHYLIARKGGFVPGCARVGDYRIVGQDILRVYGDLPRVSYSGSILLAEEHFTSDTKWQQKGLSFPSNKEEFQLGQEIKVTVDATVDSAMLDAKGANLKRKNQPGKYMLYLFRQGDVGYGGAVRYPKAGYNEAFVEQVVSPKDKYILKAKKQLPKGMYEFRLYNNRTERNGFLVSRLPFIVFDAKSPYPMEKGKPDSLQPSDLKTPGLANELKVGDFLEENTCGKSILKPSVEKMLLSFVTWEEKNKKYVPIKGALEFGQSFYIEGKLEKEASSEFYISEIKGPSGGMQEVVLWVDENDKTVVRSERLYGIWENAGIGK
jgi:hypothetical protein